MVPRQRACLPELLKNLQEMCNMALNQQTTLPISVSELVARTEQLNKDGHRLVQIGCTQVREDFEINYVFDRDFALTNLRITVKQDTIIPSISRVYFGAFVYENEIHDLYGLTVAGMNIDFGGNFYRTSVKTPFKVTISKGEEN